MTRAEVQQRFARRQAARLGGRLGAARVAVAFGAWVVCAGAVRSVAWIKAEYQNQRTNSTFLSVGSEQKAPPLP